MKTTLKSLLIATTFAGAVFSSAQTAQASDGNCGWWAFAGAFQSRSAARRQANRVGGQVYDLDQSDSPNAGKGFWVVAHGPGGRNWANQKKRQFRNRGVGGAYIASRCIWG